MRRSRTRTLLAASLLGAAVCAVAEEAAPAALRERLAASEAAEQRVRDDFQARLEAGGVSAAERAEYEAYLQRLRALVEALRGQAARLQGVAVPASPAEVAGATAPESTDERVRRLEASLGDSVSVFDEMLLREREELARKRAASASASASTSSSGASSASGSSSPSGAAASGGGWPPPEGAGGSAGTEGGLARAGSGSGSQLPGAADRTPPDVADGRDDDVVARQLREAAQSEPDPELRERLWDEYRKYKAGSP